MSELKKELGALEVFGISSGAMISSGLFVLPAVVYMKTGPAVLLSYFLAALIVIPTLFAKTELTTAMPKSGGTYFFVHRSLGSYMGTFSGIACWLSLALKSAFALVGIGVFLGPYLEAVTPLSLDMSIKVTAVLFGILFGIINSVSVKHTGKFQVWLVVILIMILVVFLVFSASSVELSHFTPFAPEGVKPVIVVSGMIFISFGGITKIASVAEEVKDPGRSIPLGMFGSFFVVTLLYLLVIFMTVGILSDSHMSSTYTPISDAALISMGRAGSMALSLAALIAFVTTGNAGILAASRYPMAMSKDNLIPAVFSKISLKYKTPVISIISTVFFMVVIILFFELEDLVKAASTMQLILFSLVCLSSVVMRESGISTYRPEFTTPLYPLVPLLGFVLYAALILTMGTFPVVVTGCVFAFSLIWYLFYFPRRVKKDSAIIHIAEKIFGSRVKPGALDQELKGILQERDDIQPDRFDTLIEKATVIDLEGEVSREELFQCIAKDFAANMVESEEEIIRLLKEREKESSTIIQKGLAIPHIVVQGKNEFTITVIRARKGVEFEKDQWVKMFFAIAGSADERNFHLQALMAIAQIVRNKNFQEQWDKMKNREDLRNLILLADRVRKGRI